VASAPMSLVDPSGYSGDVTTKGFACQVWNHPGERSVTPPRVRQASRAEAFSRVRGCITSLTSGSALSSGNAAPVNAVRLTIS
jgi:hypothetical protein